MKEIAYDKTRKGPTIKIVLGIMALALLMPISIVIAADPVAAAGTAGCAFGLGENVDRLV